MKVVCNCGNENHIEMPFDDPRTVRIQCTNACRAARQLRLDIRPIHGPLFPSTPPFGAAAQVIPFPARR